MACRPVHRGGTSGWVLGFTAIHEISAPPSLWQSELRTPHIDILTLEYTICLIFEAGRSKMCISMTETLPCLQLIHLSDRKYYRRLKNRSYSRDDLHRETRLSCLGKSNRIAAPSAAGSRRSHNAPRAPRTIRHQNKSHLQSVLHAPNERPFPTNAFRVAH